MTRLIIAALPLAFFLGACDTPETTPIDDAIAVADDDDAPADGKHGKRGDKFAKLDTDKDGMLNAAEAGIANPAKLLGHPVGLQLEGESLVECGSFHAADFKSSDETGDGKLVRSEFEDLWSLSIKRRLGVK